MIRVLLFALIAILLFMTITHTVSLYVNDANEYGKYILTVAYYKQLFDNIVDSGLFDNLYTYNGYIINGTVYTLSNQTLLPLYILTYYNQNSYPYYIALNYVTLGSLNNTNVQAGTIPNATVVTINQNALSYFDYQMSLFHNATGVNMIIYYDTYKVYANTCKSLLKYTFVTVYFDNYGFMHIIRITFC